MPRSERVVSLLWLLVMIIMSSTLAGPDGPAPAIIAVEEGVDEGKSHDDDVTAFFHGHILVLPIGMAGHVGEMGTEIVHGVIVGILTAEGVLEERFEQVGQPSRVGVEIEGEGGEDDVDGLAVPIG